MSVNSPDSLPVNMSLGSKLTIPGQSGQIWWRRADGVPGWMNLPEIKRLALAEIAQYVKKKGEYASSGLESIAIDGNLSFDDLVVIAKIINAVPKDANA